MPNTIHPTAILEGNIVMGHGNVIGPYVVMRGTITIGDNNKIDTGVVIENNVTDFVMAQAKVTEKSVSFDELMAQN